MRVGNGRYILDELLAQGGVASVYLATDTQTQERRAVKLLRAKQNTDDVIRRLHHEARVMQRLEHPNVLAIFETGEHEGSPYIVMELAERGTVADAVEHEGRIDASRAISWMLDVLSALDSAHNQDVVHRDVKPQNLLLMNDDQVKLGDFGIALAAEDEDRGTGDHALLGSGAFMPPEQAENPREVGPTADLYAVATTLFYLLTAGNPLGLYDANENSPRWHGVPEPLIPILQKAAHRDARLRYPNANAMARALRGVDLDGLHMADRSERFTAPVQEPRTTLDPHEVIRLARGEQVSTQPDAPATSEARKPLPAFVIPAVLGAVIFVGIVTFLLS